MKVITIAYDDEGMELITSNGLSLKDCVEMADAAARFYRAAWVQSLESQLEQAKGEPEEEDAEDGELPY